MCYNVKVIHTEDNYYLYDANTSNILDVDSDLIKDIPDAVAAVNDKLTLDSQAYRELKEAIDNGFIKELNESNCTLWFDESKYQNDFKKKNHLLLGVTENCNMRCKYCVYGGHYKNERLHSNKNMTYNIAEKAVDLFLSTTVSEHVVFNFYGGEPFFNFDLIQAISNYIKEKQISYSIVITTNGTLLTDKIIDWFINNDNIHIYISLAGTERMHDNLRVFQNSEVGTFTQIKKNVEKIKNRDSSKKAYPTRLNFVFNIFDEHQLFEIRNFWNTEEMFSGIDTIPEITMIDCLQDDGAVSQLGKQELKFTDMNKDPLKEYIRLLEEQKYNDIFVNYFDNKFIFVHKRDTEDNMFKLSGVCRPFIHKFFVNVDGEINICENFILNDYFGNVNTGFHIDKIQRLLERYKSSRSINCKECWARKLCSLCYKDILDINGTINQERARKLCENEKQIVEQLLIEYCTVLEINPDLLNHLDEQILVE